MNDIKEAYEHAEMTVFCPSCHHTSAAFTCELRKHPQVVCASCGCEHVVDVDGLLNAYADFFGQVAEIEKAAQGKPIDTIALPKYKDDSGGNFN
jgi:transcription elongation factor Elf1